LNQEYFDKIKKMQILNETKYLITFGDYVVENSQICISPDITKKLEELKFIREPYAWFLGQTFKYFLRPSPGFSLMFKTTIERLKIDFNSPIVG
jgi:hypothetical protein